MKTWQRFAVGTALASLLALINISRFGQVQPRMMGDELIYSRNVLLRPMAEITHPNFLYQLVYQPVLACGDNFYLCTKWINTGFLLVFAGAIYLIAAHFGRRLWALAIAVAVAIGPVAMYSSFFTPDTMFFALCALAIWSYVVRPLPTPLLNWVLLGSLLSLALLTKPHALVLMAALVLAELLAPGQDGWRGRLRSAIAPALVGSSAMAVKLALGFWIAGVDGLGIFGGRYERAVRDYVLTDRGKIFGGTGGSGQSGTSAIVDSTAPLFNFLSQLVLHLGFGVVFFGLVLLIGFRLARRAGIESRLVLVTLSAFLFGAMLSSFFVTVAPSWGESLNGQVMVRYYEYAIWLMPVIALAGIRLEAIERPTRKLMPAVWLITCALAAYWLVTNSRVLFTDGSLLGMVGGFGDGLLAVFALANLGLIAFSLFSGRSLAKSWLIGVVPVVTIAGWLGAQQQLIGPGLKTNPYIESATWVRENLQLDEYSSIFVGGVDRSLVQTTQFWIRDLDAVGVVREPGDETGFRKLESNALVILIDGLEAPSSKRLEVLHEQQFFKVLVKR